MPDMQRLKSPTSTLIMPSLSASSSQASPSPSLSASSWPEFGTNTQLSWKTNRKTQAAQFFLTLGWTECERRWGMLKVVPGYSCCLCTEAYYQGMHQYLCPFHTHSHCQPNQPHTDIHTHMQKRGSGWVVMTFSIHCLEWHNNKRIHIHIYVSVHKVLPYS